MILDREKDKVIMQAIGRVDLAEVARNLSEGQFIDDELLNAVYEELGKEDKLSPIEIGRSYQQLKATLNKERAARNFLMEELNRSLNIMKKTLE